MWARLIWSFHNWGRTFYIIDTAVLNSLIFCQTSQLVDSFLSLTVLGHKCNKGSDVFIIHKRYVNVLTRNALTQASKNGRILYLFPQKKFVSVLNAIIYSYWLGSRTTAVLCDPRTDLLPAAAGWGQQIRSRVKQNCCCPRSQSITVLLYTFI